MKNRIYIDIAKSISEAYGHSVSKNKLYEYAQLVLPAARAAAKYLITKKIKQKLKDKRKSDKINTTEMPQDDTL